MDHEFLRKLRVLGVVEAISTLLLFFGAVPLKYLYGMPIAVKIVGPIHGILFAALAFMFTQAAERVPIGKKLAVAGIVGAVVPFGPFVVDRWLGKLARQDET